MSKTLQINGTTEATLAFTDAGGAEVTLPSGNVPAWTFGQGLTGVVAADGLSAEITGVSVGVATVTVVAEGDPTPGVDTITLTGSVTVVDEASGGTITFS